MDKRTAAARILGCASEALLAFRDCGEAGAIVIGPDGRKHRLGAEELEETSPPAPAPSGEESGAGASTRHTRSRQRREPLAPLPLGEGGGEGANP